MERTGDFLDGGQGLVGQRIGQVSHRCHAGLHAQTGEILKSSTVATLQGLSDTQQLRRRANQCGAAKFAHGHAITVKRQATVGIVWYEQFDAA